MKISALLAALVFALTTMAPVSASAQHRRGHRDGYYDRGYQQEYYRGDRYRRRHDNDDAIAAGVVGLVLGLALGAAASQPRRAERCYDSYRRCAPPPQAYSGRDRYYDQGAYDGGSAYERDYGAPSEAYDAPQREECWRRERQWDRHAGRDVTVDVPC